MARTARKRSVSGFYHVVIGGIGGQVLFADGQDYSRFLQSVKRFLADSSVELHAYCLLPDRVHFLVRDLHDELDLFMKRLQGSYAVWYNHRYGRVGPLFQGRYKSETIEKNTVYSDALRYILQAPERAGLEPADRWPHSSLQEADGLTRWDYALKLFGSQEKLAAYLGQPAVGTFLEPSAPPLTDLQADRLIKDCLHLTACTELAAFDRARRDEALSLLKEKGLTVRQIERLTGIGRGIVQAAGRADSAPDPRSRA